MRKFGRGRQAPDVCNLGPNFDHSDFGHCNWRRLLCLKKSSDTEQDEGIRRASCKIGT